MAQIRPKVILTNGRVQMPLRVQILDLLVGDPIKTFLTSDTASGVSTLTVKNIQGFSTNQILLIGEPGNQGSEIIKTHASSAPSGSTITLASSTTLPHSASTFIYVIPFDQVEFSRAATLTGSKSVLATSNVLADQYYTEYNDTTNTSGYYFARFKETIGSTYSPYSDAAPYEGYGILSARAIIDGALGQINKKTSEVLSDVYAFTEIDNCQTECIRELKRWSFLQNFNQIIGNLTTNSWKVALPTDVDDQNTNKSIFQLRVGTQQRMIYVDKEKFDEFFVGVAYTTLASALNASDTTMTLVDSSDFTSTGSVTIGAYTYNYSANDTSTGILTLSTTITSTNAQAVGADVFQGATQGLPQYYTIFGGYIYYTPNTSPTYNGNNLYLDYYVKQTRITSDYQNIILPDPVLVQNFLCWKFLRKLNNGEETDSSLSYMNQYLARREKMKQKEVMNKTFKLRPRIQNFNIQTQFNEDTPRWVRDANFPSTGF